MPPELPTPQSFVPSFPPLAAFGGSPLYVTGEDALCCTVFNAASGVTVTVTGRLLEFGETRPKPFTQALTPATDRSASVARFTIGDGWLLNAQVIVSAGTPAAGQTFARLSLVRGTTTNAIDLFTLAADYITAKLPLSYPGSGVLRSTDGAGALRSIAGSTPSAGAEILETVPTGARWELLSLYAVLTTSGTVANRAPGALLDDGAAVVYLGGAGVVQTASTGWNWSISQGQIVSAGSQSGFQLLSIPMNNRLAAGYRVRTSTGNIQAGDQWSSVRLLVREWIEGA